MPPLRICRSAHKQLLFFVLCYYAWVYTQEHELRVHADFSHHNLRVTKLIATGRRNVPAKSVQFEVVVAYLLPHGAKPGTRSAINIDSRAYTGY